MIFEDPSGEVKKTKPEPMTVSVPYDELVEMLKYAKNAQTPKVDFTGSMSQMESQAKKIVESNLAKLRGLLGKYVS